MPIWANALVNLAEQVSQGKTRDTCIIISLPKLDKKTQASKWAKQLFAVAKLIQIKNISYEQLPRWIASRLEQQGQQVDPAGLNWLVSHVEGNLLAAHQEILKLDLIYPKGLISFEDIEKSVQDVARYDVFSLNLAMLRQDSKRTIKIIQGLRDEGENIIAILSFLLNDIRHIHTLSKAKRDGVSPNSLIRKLNIYPPRDQLILQVINRLSYPKTLGLIQHAHDIDSIAKGIPVTGRLNDPWEELILLSLKISNPN